MAQAVWVVLSTLVGAVLLWAAIEKLCAPARLGAAALDLGVPRWLATDAAIRFVALVELALVAGLALRPRAWPILLSLTLFGAGVIAAGEFGRARSSVGCGCFGARSTRPLGRRNTSFGVLLVATAGCLFLFGEDAASWPRWREGMVLIALASVVASGTQPTLALVDQLALSKLEVRSRQTGV